MNYFQKYNKYKIKYLNLKSKFGGNPTITLYHGSPNKLTKLIPHIPRGNNLFNTQKGIYLTSNIMDAKLYSILRNEKNRNFAVVNGIAYLLKSSWLDEGKYQFNNKGYVYVVRTSNYEQSPYNPNEYIVKNELEPNETIEISLSDILPNIKYLNDEEYRNLMNRIKI
jgi:hypothetical protein